METRRIASRTEKLVVGLFCAGMGVFILLMSAGFIPHGKANAPMWVGGLGGAVFLFAGLGVIMGAMKGASPYDGELPKEAPFALRVLQYLLGMGAVACLAAVGTWVAFGPGERKFSATVWFWSGPGNEIVGRAAFGFGAILVWTMFLFFAVRGARKLFGRQQTQ